MHRIRVEPAGPTLAAAIAGYLATLDHPETAATRRVYAGTPGRVVRHARC